MSQGAENPFDQRNRPARGILRWLVVSLVLMPGAFVILVWLGPSNSGGFNFIDADIMHLFGAFCVLLIFGVIAAALTAAGWRQRKGRRLVILLLLLHYLLAGALVFSTDLIRQRRDLGRRREEERQERLRPKDRPGKRAILSHHALPIPLTSPDKNC